VIRNLRTTFLLGCLFAPALTYALDDCSAQLAKIDNQLESTDESATNIVLAMQMRQTIEQMCFMLDEETMSKMLEGIDEVLKTDLGRMSPAAVPAPEPATATTRKSSSPKADPGALVPPAPTGRSLGARFIDRPEKMDMFAIWDVDMLGSNARVLYTSGPSLPQLGLPDWQQYIYVVEMTPAGLATQTMVTSKQAQDHAALALRRGHDEIHFQRQGAERGDPSTLELWSVSGQNRLSSAITPAPLWPDGTKWDWQPFRMATSDGNVLFSNSKTNRPDDKSLIAWFEAGPNGDIAGQGSTVRTDQVGEGAWVETDNGGGGLIVRLSANDMSGIETRLATPIKRQFAGRDIHAIVFSEVRLLVTSDDARSAWESDALSRTLAWDGEMAVSQDLAPMERSRQAFEQMAMTQAVAIEVGASREVEYFNVGFKRINMIRPTSNGYVALVKATANRNLDPPVHGPYLLYLDKDEESREVYLNPMAEALNVDLKILAVSRKDDIYVFGTTLGRGVDAYIIRVGKDGTADAYAIVTKTGNNHVEAMLADDTGVWLFGQGTMEGRVAPRLFVERIEFPVSH
jgi:hypothetical protein